MKRLFYLSILLIPSLAYPQEEKSERQTLSVDLFYQGKVILQNGDTLTGLVKCYYEQNIIQVIGHTASETLSSENVFSFEITDRLNKCTRQFYSMRYSKTGTYKSPVFFELLCKGKITLLARESVEARTNRGPGLHVPPVHLVVVNKYFLQNDDGTIVDMSPSRINWYELMTDHASEMREYVKRNRLDFNSKYQLQDIINHFNLLSSKQSVFSSVKKL